MKLLRPAGAAEVKQQRASVLFGVCLPGCIAACLCAMCGLPGANIYIGPFERHRQGVIFGHGGLVGVDG